MKTIVRSLLVWFLLLALPFQAFAAASMLPRVERVLAAVQAQAEVPPCHGQMAMQMAEATPADGKAGHQANKQAGKHHAGQSAKGKCSAGSACCVGAALASSLPAALSLPPAGTVSIPFRAGYLPSVDPVLLERPPSSLLA